MILSPESVKFCIFTHSKHSGITKDIFEYFQLKLLNLNSCGHQNSQVDKLCFINRNSILSFNHNFKQTLKGCISFDPASHPSSHPTGRPIGHPTRKVKKTPTSTITSINLFYPTTIHPPHAQREQQLASNLVSNSS